MLLLLLLLLFLLLLPDAGAPTTKVPLIFDSPYKFRSTPATAVPLNLLQLPRSSRPFGHTTRWWPKRTHFTPIGWVDRRVPRIEKLSEAHSGSPRHLEEEEESDQGDGDHCLQMLGTERRRKKNLPKRLLVDPVMALVGEGNLRPTPGLLHLPCCSLLCAFTEDP